MNKPNIILTFESSGHQNCVEFKQQPTLMKTIDNGSENIFYISLNMTDIYMQMLMRYCFVFIIKIASDRLNNR